MNAAAATDWFCVITAGNRGEDSCCDVVGISRKKEEGRIARGGTRQTLRDGMPVFITKGTEDSRQNHSESSAGIWWEIENVDTDRAKAAHQNSSAPKYKYVARA